MDSDSWFVITLKAVFCQVSDIFIPPSTVVFCDVLKWFINEFTGHVMDESFCVR